MRAVELQRDFGLEHLHVTDRPDPACGPGQVRIEVTAASLNYRDLLMVTGRYNPRQPLPLVPLSDGVGRVLEVGDGVTELKEGDRVCGLFCPTWMDGAPDRAALRQTRGGPLDGMAAEQVVSDARGVHAVPAHLSDAEAATLPCAALTAWSALITHGHLVAGERVLVLGTGGVSLFAVQIAKLFGAEVFVTSRSEEKLARALALGADHGIVTGEDPAFDKKIRALTDGDGVDHVVEVGGPGTLDRSIKCARPGGSIHLIGVLAEAERPPNLVAAFMAHLRLQGILVGHRASFTAMCRAFALHEVKPVLDARAEEFGLADIGAALSYLGEGKHVGKVCVRVSDA